MQHVGKIKIKETKKKKKKKGKKKRKRKKFDILLKQQKEIKVKRGEKRNKREELHFVCFKTPEGSNSTTLIDYCGRIGRQLSCLPQFAKSL